MVPGRKTPLSKRFDGTVNPSLTSAVGEPVAYVQASRLKVIGAVLLRLS